MKHHHEGRAFVENPRRSFYDQLQAQGCGIEKLESYLIEEAVRGENGNLAAAACAHGLTQPQLSYR